MDINSSYGNSQLAEASYADLSNINNDDQYIAALTEQGKGMSSVQAKE